METDLAKHGYKLSLDFLQKILDKNNQKFLVGFERGQLKIEIYKPKEVDLQQTHDQDEIYIVMSGKGQFFCNHTEISFKPMDLLFVPAHMPHSFKQFTDDLVVWVIFYGPPGGDQKSITSCLGGDSLI
ncbi:MAG: cupin domain-containing protein [Alphaproteobacteria bacterium]|nr:cupin domain-containing protein [Alphaproteobacteria bacterium]